MTVISRLVLNIIILALITVDQTQSILEFSSDIYVNEHVDNVIWLKPNTKFSKNGSEVFQIYCFGSTPKSVFQMWRSVYLMLDNIPQSYNVFPGINETEVKTKYAEHSMWNPSSWIAGQKSYVDFPAFSKFCVGLDTQERYVISLQVRTINYWRVLQTTIGVMLFLCAHTLSRNPFFHYTSAVSLGVVGSLLIVIYILSRFFPKKPSAYTVLFFGYSFVLYLLQVVWKSFNDIIANYMEVLLGYCFCAAFISFIVCYRMGPIQNVRTFNIIQWVMQIMAVFLIYLSSEYREVSTAIVLLLITGHIIPTSWIAKFHQIWYRIFPPKVRLLTESEYIEQGHLETRKALEQLRSFCSSPDCNAWKTVSKLKDPTRFASFMDSGSHCSDEELLTYNSECYDTYNDEREDEEEEENGDQLHQSSYSMNRSNGYSNLRQ